MAHTNHLDAWCEGASLREHAVSIRIYSPPRPAVTQFDSAQPGWNHIASLFVQHTHLSKKKKSRVMARTVQGEIAKYRPLSLPNPRVIKFPSNLHYAESSQLYWDSGRGRLQAYKKDLLIALNAISMRDPKQQFYSIFFFTAILWMLGRGDGQEGPGRAKRNNVWLRATGHRTPLDPLS